MKKVKYSLSSTSFSLYPAQNQTYIQLEAGTFAELPRHVGES
jgi:hypothetical protein